MATRGNTHHGKESVKGEPVELAVPMSLPPRFELPFRLVFFAATHAARYSTTALIIFNEDLISWHEWQQGHTLSHKTRHWHFDFDESLEWRKQTSLFLFEYVYQFIFCLCWNSFFVCCVHNIERTVRVAIFILIKNVFFCFVYNNALCACLRWWNYKTRALVLFFGGVSGRIKNTFL